MLKRLAADGTTVVTSIHQPRGSIYNLFDDLILVANRRVVYNGKAARAASHFATLGYPCPANINAGEHVVDIVSPQYGSDTQRATYDARLLKFEAAPAKPFASAPPPPPSATASTGAAAGTTAEPSVDSTAVASSRRGGAHIGTQFVLLFRRAWREVARSKAAVAIKVAQQVMAACTLLPSLTDSYRL